MKELGKYEILEEIGRGGFGTVYKARDASLDRVIALKVLHPQLTIDPKFIQRFRHEAQTAANLRHPHIVTIHDVGEESGQYFLAMAFLPGEALSQLIERGPLPVDRAIAILEQIASALDYISGQGLIHRDVKPSNIRVHDAEQATLLDFGTVRAAEGTRLTTTMAVLGTPEYMAPEQAEIEEAAGIDWRVDLYALGVVAYEMLVGRPPFTGRSPTGILYKHIHEPPPPPTELNPSLPGVLGPVLLKALAKDREARYQTAGAMVAALKEVAEGEARAEQVQARLAELYRLLNEAVRDQQWATAEARYREIHALDPAYRDAPELWVQVREAQARQRELKKTEADRLAAEKAEAERLATEKAEADRLAAEKAKAERLAAEKAEAERLAAEKAKAERLAAERARAERLAAEKAEAERIAAERARAKPPLVEKAETTARPTPSRPVPAVVPETDLPTLGWVRGLAVLAPGVILFALLRWLPMLATVGFSFQKRDFRSTPQFVGLQNYVSLATDSMTGPALRNTIGLVVIRLLVVGIVWWVLRAAWLKRRRAPTWLVLAAVAPLPFFSPVGSAVCWQFLGRPDIGLVGRIISWYSPSDALLLLLIVDGLHTLAFASAGGLLAYGLGQKQWKVTPHPSPTVLSAMRNVMLVVAAAGALQSLTWGLVITQGNFGTMTPLLAVYQLQYKYGKIGYGSAYSTVVLVVLIALAVILWKMIKTPPLRLVSQPLDTAPEPEDRAVSTWELWLLGLLPSVVILLPYVWLLWLLLARPEAIMPERPVLLRESWGRPLVNSLVPGVAVWVVQLPVALLTAYAVSLRRLPGKATNRVLYLLFVVAAIISPGVVSAPLYDSGAVLGWLNTAWAAVLPAFSSGVVVILFALFFKGLAPRLAQARARGDAEASIFRRDILPAAWPFVLLVGVASTWWATQRILWPLLFLTSPEWWSASRWAYQTIQFTGISVEAGTSAMLSVFPLAIPFAVALVFLVRVILRRMALVAQDEQGT